MTIDEEIKHQEEISDRYARMSEYEGNEGIAKDCAQCAADHAQLAEWLTELKEAKRLLKLAVENMNDGGCTRSCSTCKYGRDGCKYTEGYEWVHTEEAAKLLKED